MNEVKAIEGGSGPKEESGVQEARGIAADIRRVLEAISSDASAEPLDDIEKSYQEQNRDFLCDCLIVVLSEMTAAERKTFLETDPLDMQTVIRRALEKLGLAGETEKIKEILSRISSDDLKMPSALNLKLGIGKEGGLMAKLQQAIDAQIDANDKAMMISGLLLLSHE